MVKIRKSIFIALIFMILLTACQNGSRSNLEMSEPEKEVLNPKENFSFLTDAPLEILYTDDKLWGTGYDSNDAPTVNYINLSNLCKEKFGFPVKFTKISASQFSQPASLDSAFALHIQAGLSGDLIFPCREIDYENKHDFHWGPSYTNLYMDLTPYLERFCPEAILNFERYPQIKDNFIINGKVYAIYAGMPNISAIALMVKNDLLEKTGVDIHTVNNVDALYEFMDSLSHGSAPESQLNKIATFGFTLLKYAAYNSGYYFKDSESFVFDMNDEKCIPHLIEETEILDNFYNIFNRFFKDGYFSYGSNIYDLIGNGSQEMALLNWYPFVTKEFSKYSIDEKDNILKKILHCSIQ